MFLEHTPMISLLDVVKTCETCWSNPLYVTITLGPTVVIGTFKWGRKRCFTCLHVESPTIRMKLKANSHVTVTIRGLVCALMSEV